MQVINMLSLQEGTAEIHQSHTVKNNNALYFRDRHRILIDFAIPRDTEDTLGQFCVSERNPHSTKIQEIYHKFLCGHSRITEINWFRQE